ncbi:MAG: DUF1579 domain-containing protein [Phycisphaerales bacterium]
MTTRALLTAVAITAMGMAPAFAQDTTRPGNRPPTATPPPVAQPPKTDAQPPSMDAEMQAWMEAGAVGPNHKLLEGMVGEWTTAGKFWMGPGEPMTTAGTSVNTPVLGGRYIQQKFKGDFMGQPFEGIGYTGYDNIKQKFVGTWMDSMSTSVMNSEGTWDAATKSFTFTSEFQDPAGKMVKSRETVKVVDENTHVFTMYHTEPGQQENRVMELTYTRKGAARPAMPSSDRPGSEHPEHPARPATPPTPGGPATPKRPGSTPGGGR